MQGQGQRLHGGGIDFHTDHGARALRQLDRQGAQPGPDLDDAILDRQLQGLHQPFELRAVRQKILPPAAQIANPEAARHAADG